MMTDRPALFDPVALARNRARVSDHALFLHEAAVDEIDERLKEVNRTFTDTAVITGTPGPWAKFGKIVNDDERIALAEASQDLVIHAMSLHWAEDPVGQLVQSRLALRPDGLFIAAFFGGSTLQELRAVLAEAEAAVTGGLSPRVAPMGEIRDLGGLLQRAGFALPVADGVSTRVEYNSPRALMRELRQMGEGNALAARLRRPTRRAVFDKAAEIYEQTFGTPEGRIPATFEIIYLTGWAPSADQPEPLRPGSAKTRLSDALGVPELDPERDRE